MRRTITFVALWLAAGALAAAVATAGVAVVSRQLTGSHPAPLSAEQVRAAVDADATTTTVGIATTSTTVSDPGATTTTPTSEGVTVTTAPTSPTTSAPPQASTTKTYHLVGGTATLRFSASGVDVVAATPAPGFTVDIGGSHDGGARVEFESDDHRSRVDAWWDGAPRDEVSEDGDDSDD